jgi:hypothetical protein
MIGAKSIKHQAGNTSEFGLRFDVDQGHDRYL